MPAGDLPPSRGCSLPHVTTMKEHTVIIDTAKPGSTACEEAPGSTRQADHPQPRKGLRLSVYRAAGRPDCTLGGISANAEDLTVTTIRERGAGGEPTDRPLPEDCQVFAPGPDAPEAILVITRRPRGARWVHLQPAANPGWHYMHGGNYAGTSDGRWEPLAGTDLVAIHDRHEG
jgi:hypothetical protein